MKGSPLAPLRSSSLLVGAICFMLGLSPAGAQQAWPTKPVRLVIPYEAGGLADRLGRIIADKLSERLGQRVLPENRAGSAGLIAGGVVAKAAPDGYTLMVGGTGPHVTGPATNRNAGYDPLKDFTHIAMIGGDVFLLAANPARGWRTLADMERTAKEPGAVLDYGSTGNATPTHLVMESYLASSKLKITHIPYKGGGPAIQATLGNHTPMVLVTLSSLAPHITSGRLVPLALSSSARHSAFPAISTFAEQGHPAVDGGTLFWLAGPARLPEPIVTRLNREVRASLALADVRETFEKQLLITSDQDVAQFQDFVGRQVSSWSQLIAALGIKIE
jgi:tripartite-type tricarboxylate transporter receptor subunit TctC